MRENPWHLRLASTEHYQWFRNLVDFHELTTGWVKQLQQQEEKQSHAITRGLSEEVTENLWMLELLSETRLDRLLDDTHPRDLLCRLEHTTWAVQAGTLNSIYGKTSHPSSRSALDSQLEQIAWKLGRRKAEARWPELTTYGRQDLRDVLMALNDSPFVGYPLSDGILIRRAIRSEIEIELRACPHQNPFPEVRTVADKLCRFHSHWMRGFAYALNNKATLEHVVQSPRCIQRWFFV